MFEIEKKNDAKKKFEQQKKKLQEQEKQQKLNKGRPGKGEKDNYKWFCRKCLVEYEIDLDNCTRCGGDLITHKDRYAELMDKVEDFKSKKMRKQERKKKWEMWKKTQAIFRKKNSTNYQKWEYFTDSEDEFEELEKQAEPVTPKDDPSFIAMKKDMEDRAKRRRAKAREAHKMKLEGNKMMKKKDYVKAIELYTKGLDLRRDNKFLWTNRAMAHLKREDWEKAIDDCTKLIEYCEVMENGYVQSRDSCFKAFARRAKGYLGQKKFDLALNDAGKCVELYPDDEAAKELKAEVEEKLKYQNELDEAEEKISKLELEGTSSSLKQEIDRFLKLGENLEDEKNSEELKNFDYTKLSKISEEQNKILKLYFLRRKGLDLIQRLQKKRMFVLSFRENKLDLVNFLHLVCNGDNAFITRLTENQFIRTSIKIVLNNLQQIYPTDENGQKITEQSNKNQEEKENKNPKKISKLDGETQAKMMTEIEELSELLILFTETRSVRIYMRERDYLMVPLFSLLYDNLIYQFETESHVISSLLSLFSNLMVSEVGTQTNDIKDGILELYKSSFFANLGAILKVKKIKFLNLKKSCMAFLSNLHIDKSIRAYSISKLVEFRTLEKKTGKEIVPTAEINSVVFFLKNLFEDSLFTIAQMISKDSKLSINQRRYFENMTGLILNMLFGQTNKVVVESIKTVLNKLGAIDVVVKIVSAFVLKFSIEGNDLIISRGLAILTKLWDTEKIIHHNESLLKILPKLVAAFDEDPNKNPKLNPETSKFIVMIMNELPELSKKLELLLLHRKDFINHVKNVVLNEESLGAVR